MAPQNGFPNRPGLSCGSEIKSLRSEVLDDFAQSCTIETSTDRGLVGLQSPRRFVGGKYGASAAGIRDLSNDLCSAPWPLGRRPMHTTSVDFIPFGDLAEVGRAAGGYPLARWSSENRDQFTDPASLRLIPTNGKVRARRPRARAFQLSVTAEAERGSPVDQLPSDAKTRSEAVPTLLSWSEDATLPAALEVTDQRSQVRKITEYQVRSTFVDHTSSSSGRV
ncbi:unnamed protein product [Protopolystoma xenopodis]|uniref:Uncharacterized protein n=1 Tax=Protopolystoma xenopodis TaxID=117903 RepID=A0A448XDI4_9PLAT|nr:unnamed protein product [Protopolystoma xenopodis]